MHGKFGVIVVDPPWEYNQYRDKANGAAKANYDCIVFDDLAAIDPINKWGKESCLLALWCTGPTIADGRASKLMEAWGCQGKTLLPWLKNSPTTQDLSTGVGIWFMGNCEYIMFGVKGKIGNFNSRRGKLGVLVEDRFSPTFWKRLSEINLLAPKSRVHSKKPETLQDYLETFDGPYLELFATRQREGWTCWGKDLGQTIDSTGVHNINATPSIL